MNMKRSDKEMNKELLEAWRQIEQATFNVKKDYPHRDKAHWAFGYLRGTYALEKPPYTMIRQQVMKV